MYLPEDIIKDILSHCGITGYEKLYLSSSIKELKEQGLCFVIS